MRMTMRARFDHPTTWIAAGFAALAAMLLIGLGLASGQRAENGMIVRTLEVEQRLATVLTRLQDAEIGSRDYYLTGQPEFLGAYRDAVASLGGELDGLATATADNAVQRSAMTRLRSLAADKMAQVARTLELRRQNAADITALTRSVRDGRTLMSAFRAEIGSMRAEEIGLLAQRQARSDSSFAWTRVFLLAGLVLVAGMTTFALYDNMRRLALVSARHDDLTQANAELVTGVQRSEDAESQVRQMQKMEAVGQLTGGIAHDFNNMLSVVIGSLDLARRRLTREPERADHYIGVALQGAQRAATLTARLLAFSRQQPLSPEDIDPNRLVAGMSEMLRRSLGEDMQLEAVLAGGVWRVHADASQLENAIVNLCVNARDAMADGGRLTIETSNAHLDEAYARLNGDVSPGQYVLFSVTDNGAGMTAAVVQQAFEPFFTTKDVGKGTGLGLSQVFGFMKQSGGHVKIYSEVGVGTSVKIYLPRWLGGASAGPATAIAPSLPASAHQEVILVVEDDADVQMISVDSLRELGYSVLRASSAEEALQAMALAPHIDLLFTDIVMPGVTGRVLADKASQQRPGLKILYTTGYTRNAVVHNGVLDAGVDLLPKPFTVEQLALKVRQVLDGRGARA